MPQKKSTKAKATKAKATKPKGKRGRKRKKYYVDPKVFTKQILEYYETDNMTSELGEAVYNIANRLGYAPNFINYTYKEEMVGDAVVKMISALKNKKFDCEKGNPFSYFTKIAFNAFCNRIKKEKKAREVLLNYQNDVYTTLMDSGHIPQDSHTTSEFDDFE